MDDGAFNATLDTVEHPLGAGDADSSMPLATVGQKIRHSLSGRPSPARRNSTPTSATSPRQGPAVASSSSTTPTSPSTPSRLSPLRLPTGEVYEGPLVDGKPHGLGQMEFAGMYRFRGHFFKGVRRGNGSLLMTVGEKYAVHCSWIDDRIDDRRPAKMEYASGEVYYGVLAASCTAPVIDSFLTYLRNLHLNRAGMGELCSSGKGRYFGSWRQNKRSWYGVQIFADGSKYYGHWEADVRQGHGVMLHADGSIYEGLWRRDEPCGQGTLQLPNGTVVTGIWKGEHITAKATCTQQGHEVPMWSRARVAKSWGLLLGTSANRPRLKRVSTRWRDFGATVQAEFLEERRRNETQMESSFVHMVTEHLSAKHGSKLQAMPVAELLALMSDEDCALLRPHMEQALGAYLQHAFTPRKQERGRHVLGGLASWFQRYFIFMYGSCAAPDEIGAGLNTPLFKCGYFDDTSFLREQQGKGAPSLPNHPLSYCCGRNHFGGCIHRGRGQKIEEHHLHNACEDMVSFLYKLNDHLKQALGSNLCHLLLNRMDLGRQVFKSVNDHILGRTYPVLYNLYCTVHQRDDVRVLQKLKSLRKVTLDDIGVSFGRDKEEEELFQPYDTAIQELSQLPNYPTVQEKLRCLRKVAADIDQLTMLNQLKARAPNTRTAYQDVMASHRKRAGSRVPEVIQAPSDVDGDDLCEANGGGTPPARTPVARSPDDTSGYELAAADASLLYMASNTTNPLASTDKSALSSSPTSFVMIPRLSAAACVVASGLIDNAADMAQMVQNIEGGSADDLFPINLYIFIKAGMATCVSEQQFLLDWTSNSDILDSTSDDAYRLATLQACISYVQELDWNVRDSDRVLVPSSVLESHLQTACLSAIGDMRRAGRLQFNPRDKTLLDQFPQLEWVRDGLLHLGAAEIDDYELVDPAKQVRIEGEPSKPIRLLPLPARNPPPPDCVQVICDILQSIGLILVFGRDRLPFHRFLASASHSVKSTESPGQCSSSSDGEWTAMQPRWKGKQKRKTALSSEPLIPATLPLALQIEKHYSSTLYLRLADLFTAVID